MYACEELIAILKTSRLCLVYYASKVFFFTEESCLRALQTLIGSQMASNQLAINTGTICSSERPWERHAAESRAISRTRI